MFSSKQGTLGALLLVSVLCFGSAARAAEWNPLLPEQLNWIESPAYPGVTFAVLAGGMGKPGVFTVRARFPPNYQLGPHTHTDDRGLTILGGQLEAGDRNAVRSGHGGVDAGWKLCAHPGESGPLRHRRARGRYGPGGMGGSKTEYLDAADDPKTRYGR